MLILITVNTNTGIVRIGSVGGKMGRMRCSPSSVQAQKKYVTLRYATLRYVTLRYVTLRYVTLRYVTLTYVPFCSSHVIR